jgi:hypothetical protein
LRSDWTTFNQARTLSWCVLLTDNHGGTHLMCFFIAQDTGGRSRSCPGEDHSRALERKISYRRGQVEEGTRGCCGDRGRVPGKCLQKYYFTCRNGADQKKLRDAQQEWTNKATEYCERVENPRKVALVQRLLDAAQNALKSSEKKSVPRPLLL